MGFRQILELNQPIIFFLYGLAFFLMGWSIWFQPRFASTLRLAQRLPYLALFGILHGVTEWGDVFIPIQRQYLGPVGIQRLVALHALLMAASFLALLLFGAFLVADSHPRLRWLPALAVLTFGVWAGKAMFGQAVIRDPARWSADAETWARYLLAVPGALLAGLGLRMQAPQFLELGYPRLIRDLRGASVALFVYAVAGGLLVPPGAFFPANFFNRELLLAVGLPAQIPRALCAAAIAFYIVRLLRVFDAENRHRVEAAEGARAAAEERERLGRELHDGILQSIYAAGLGLQVARTRLGPGQAEAGQRIDQTVARLDRIMAEIRTYILGLDRGERDTRTLREHIGAAITEFEATYGIPVEFCMEGIPARPVDQETVAQACAIAREALNNAGRHARASSVQLRVELAPNGMTVAVRDDGQGFDVPRVLERAERGGHFGLRNVFRRAELAGGHVKLESAPGRGARVKAWLPYSQEGGAVNREYTGAGAARG